MSCARTAVDSPLLAYTEGLLGEERPDAVREPPHKAFGGAKVDCFGDPCEHRMALVTQAGGVACGAATPSEVSPRPSPSGCPPCPGVVRPPRYGPAG